MIVIALGANLPSRSGAPRDTLKAALAAVSRNGVDVVAVSFYYVTKAWPDASDPPFVNAVAQIKTWLSASELMTLLHRTEMEFGRVRGAKNAPRTLDLDLIDFDGDVAAHCHTNTASYLFQAFIGQLLNFGFENFDSARPYRAGQVVKNVKLYRGIRDSVDIGFAQDFYVLVAKGAVSRVKAEVLTQQPIIAPVRKGQPLGLLRLSVDGVPLGEYPLTAMQDVEVAGWLGRAWDSIRLLFSK